jgi:hypothetical protein
VDDHLSCSSLETVTFAPGSKLTKLEHWAFSGCTALKSIRLPASLQQLHARAFEKSAVTHIEIESGNEFYSARGDFVIGIKPPLSLACYVGRLATVAIDDDIETIASCVFVPSPFVERVTFGAASRLRTIEKTVFKGCKNLESIAIPSTVTSIARNAFARCTGLSTMTFVSPSSLAMIHSRTFRTCVNLKAIVIPGSLVVLHVNCFNRCTGLAEVSFESPSHLLRIEFRAFAECSALPSICIPSSVERIEESCFLGCSSMANLTFARPSHLTELRSLPARPSYPLDVPDSVEICTIEDLVPSPGRYLLRFGRDSKLREPRPQGIGSRIRGERNSPVFLQLASAALKRLRATLDCGLVIDEDVEPGSSTEESSDDSGWGPYDNR